MSVINKIREKQGQPQPAVSQESLEDFIKDGYENCIHAWRGLQAIWQREASASLFMLFFTYRYYRM